MWESNGQEIANRGYHIEPIETTNNVDRIQETHSEMWGGDESSHNLILA